MKTHKSNYAAWDINDADFPYDGSQEDQIKFLLGFGALAPSQHNTQPWSVEVAGTMAHIKPDPNKQLPVGDPLRYGLWISFGCFIENVVQAAQLFGISVEVSYESEMITLAFSGTATALQTGTTDFIKQRFSYKKLFNETDITVEEMAAIHEAMIHAPTGTATAVIENNEARKQFISIHMKAADVVASNPDFGRELSHWLRNNLTKKVDGMPGFISGMPLLKSLLGPKLLSKKPELLKQTAKQDEQLLESSKALLVWNVTDTSQQSIVLAGRHIQSVWLKLAKLGLFAHPMIASTSNAETAEQIASLANLPGIPIFVMRVGNATDSKLRTPRKMLF